MTKYLYQPKIDDHGHAIRKRVNELYRKTYIRKSALIRRAIEIGLNHLESNPQTDPVIMGQRGNQ